MSKRFVVVEGPDGSGKSTTINKLGELLDFHTIKTPPEHYRRIRQKYDSFDVDPKVRFDFYARGLKESVDEIFQKLGNGRKGVLVDRYTDSLQIYHHTMDPHTNYAQLLSRFGIPREELCIVLSADIDVLANRICARNSETADSKIERDFEFLRKVNEQFQKLSGEHVFHVDTGKYGVDEVLEKCVQVIRY